MVRKLKYEKPRVCRICGDVIHQPDETLATLICEIQQALYAAEAELFVPQRACGVCQKDIARRIIESFNDNINKRLREG